MGVPVSQMWTVATYVLRQKLAGRKRNGGNRQRNPSPVRLLGSDIGAVDQRTRQDGEDDKPVTGMTYRITLPDGETVAEGTLNEKGFCRVDGIEPGSCKITFPLLDQDAWEKK